ncbi:outer membrane beta-barrel protein [Chryseobacterium culicis]|jgi:hypothetical protein|uniref:Outer membrane protein beta-barrel domain-containing protein n=1 Tax=Chryseobacterium culicis TaxID=680127 RepID=A0A1H6H0X8_CHRCI|nr:outer membrane beta-barrel protein [Chryseobacterium culicis]MBE4947376.1 outer membrane beta-barrel protein [Chryseobacterium culicis]SEH27835.1 Outer membrane protein beta-barrel domain-containing protein [Chryseobacterium culicis]
MKKLILTGILAVAGLTATANAQIQKGNWMVGGNLAGANFGLNKGGGYDFNIQPKGAYFIEDNIALGGYVDLGFKGAKDAPTTFTYNVGALGRYYLNPGEQGVDNLLHHGRWFFEGNLGVGGTSISKGGSSSNGLNFGFGPGYSYFITPNIGLEGLVKYDANAGFGSGGYTNKITFGLGFQIYLPTSKGKQIINDVK